MDLDRKDPEALRASLEVANDLISHLTNYVQRFVVPCFPPYYKIYENIKKIYMEMIHDHLVDQHIGPYMGQYMDEAGAEILLDVRCFIGEANDNLQKSDQKLQIDDLDHTGYHPLLTDIYNKLSDYFGKFLDHSGREFGGRFERILQDQHRQERQIVAQSKEKKKKGRSQADFQMGRISSVSGSGSNPFETTFDQDVYEFVDTQLESISQILDQDQLA